MPEGKSKGSLASYDGRSWTVGRSAPGTLVLLLALVSQHASGPPPLVGAARSAAAAAVLSEEQMNRLRVTIRERSDTDEGIPAPGNGPPAADRTGPASVGVDEAPAPVVLTGEPVERIPPSAGPRPDHPVAAPAAKPTSGAAPGARARFFVQLAALRDAAGADPAWQRLRRDHGEILTGLERTVERAETGRGLFHRILVGPFVSRSAAAGVCRALQRRQQDCLVVRREA